LPVNTKTKYKFGFNGLAGHNVFTLPCWFVASRLESAMQLLGKYYRSNPHLAALLSGLDFADSDFTIVKTG